MVTDILVCHKAGGSKATHFHKPDYAEAAWWKVLAWEGLGTIHQHPHSLWVISDDRCSQYAISNGYGNNQ